MASKKAQRTTTRRRRRLSDKIRAALARAAAAGRTDLTEQLRVIYQATMQLEARGQLRRRAGEAHLESPRDELPRRARSTSTSRS